MARILRRAVRSPPMRVPRALAETWSHEPEWLEALPRARVASAPSAWALELEEPIDTPHSLVVPAGDVVLKLNAPSHVEADHEADALARWGGRRRGAAARARRRAARAPPRALRAGDAALGRRTSTRRRSSPSCSRASRSTSRDAHPFALLADEADRWAEDVPRWYAEAGEPFERALLDVALDVYRTVDRSALTGS